MRAILLAALALAAPAIAAPEIELARMTTPELRARVEGGCPVGLIVNAGVEQTGPHVALGKHILRAEAYGARIARTLGDAVLAPVLPLAPNPERLAEVAGTLTLRPETFTAYNEDTARSLIRAGFRRVALMGDHGVGQEELAALATQLDGEHRGRGVRIFYIGDFYTRARAEIEAEIRAMGKVSGGHGGLWDTAETLAVDPSAVRPKLFAAGSLEQDGNGPYDARGVSGDPRGATAALGRRFGARRVALAVAQIRAVLADAGPCR